MIAVVQCQVMMADRGTRLLSCMHAMIAVMQCQVMMTDEEGGG